MASLAIIVSLIFLCLVLIGPLSYILSLFGWMPNLIKYILSIICMIVGLWAVFIPVPLFRILGIINFLIGLKIVLETNKKTTQA
jgi:hypothetical protein